MGYVSSTILLCWSRKTVTLELFTGHAKAELINTKQRKYLLYTCFISLAQIRQQYICTSPEMGRELG